MGHWWLRDSAPTLRSARIPLTGVQAQPLAPQPNREPVSLRSCCCGLALPKTLVLPTKPLPSSSSASVNFTKKKQVMRKKIYDRDA
ncbi:hypothetical protein PoB_001461300 [Plakobranchus ocellatus]|uniref:Uncharacterized protein n=1 Tax=Plakobranchus ocellatus TaxID=259542 RepID=A0AAV3Z0F4_9GAST|nr:hypothetical protein PoB_001461300 [Plakobranchus ocellatus]